MASDKVKFPGPGCVVEFLQGNSPMPAFVLESQNGKLRLYTRARREQNLPLARLLPWSGPALSSGLTRQDMDRILEQRWEEREARASGVNVDELWQLAQGEVEKASPEWLASLLWEAPAVDDEAALGRALLSCKTHFRFNPPDFEIFPAEVVERRIAEAEAMKLREAIAGAGAQFFQVLWEIYQSKRGPLQPREEPEGDLAGRLRDILLRRLAEPENDQDGQWKQLVKGLPEHPHMALVLATAWGLVPEHYNFWLDRAGYERGERWAEEYFTECASLIQAEKDCLPGAEPEQYGLITADPQTTEDRDDACFVALEADGSFRAEVALACPAAVWPFGGQLDRAVMRRASSLYLPEGDQHMLPGSIGWRLFGLDEGQDRLSFCVSMRFDAQGNCLFAEPRLTRVRVSANLHLEECEGVLESSERDQEPSGNFPVTERALEHRYCLTAMLLLARKLQNLRLAGGAVITERPDPDIRVFEKDGKIQVSIENPPEPHRIHTAIGEMMIAVNAAMARWCVERDIPVFFRTQDVGLPREFSGIWRQPQDIARVIRSLPGAVLEPVPRRHAGLGLCAYATFSSPIRRYTDLFNQGQVLGFIRGGKPLFDSQAVTALLPLMSARNDAVIQVQRNRPRYWKLLFFRRHGDKCWWDGVITEENEHFATVSLPWAQINIRGKRRLFDEKIQAGQAVQIRISKVNPLTNDIQILEAREA